MRVIVRRILTEAGFEIIEAGDGAAALAELRAKGPFDLAVVDWNMPIMDGLELLLALQRGEAPRPTHIVMCTTETEPERIVRALEAGATEYLMKPFSKEAVLDKLMMLGLREVA